MATKFTLRTRILAPVLGILALGLVGMVTVIVLVTGAEFRKAAYSENSNISYRYAEQFEGEVGRALGVAQSLARTLASLRLAGITDRTTYDALLAPIVDAHPMILSVWTLWSPSSPGRVLVQFAKTGSGVEKSLVPEFDLSAGGDRFGKPIDGQTFFSEPIPSTAPGQEGKLVASYSMPVVVDDQVVAVVGVDLDIGVLQAAAKPIQIFGTGYLVMTSHTGARIVHPKAEQIGKIIGDDTPEHQPAILQAIAEGRPYDLIKPNKLTGVPSLLHYAPVGVGVWDEPWSIISIAPLGELLATQNLMTAWTVGLGLLTFVAIAALIFLLVTRITQPVRLVAGVLKTIAEGEGDLTQCLRLTRTDEIGELSRNYDAFVDKLSEMIGMMQGTAQELQGSGSELASALTQTAASLHEITSNIQSAKDNIVRQEKIATDTSHAVKGISGHVVTLQGLVERQDRSVEASGSAVEQMVGNIESVTRNVETLDRSLKRLIEAAEVGRSQFSSFREKVSAVDGQSDSLQETNEMIASIASQTNLLAMNAAIEAAHAGEAGRGFGVVADEIRKLAEQSALQSKTTAEELKGLQATIRALVGDSDATEQAFGRILEEIGQVEALESEVRSAMEEQQVGSRQILEGIHEIREASHEVRSHSEEMQTEAEVTLATMETLERITLEIRRGMDEIAVGASDINQALALISNQGVRNKEAVDELASEADRFKVTVDTLDTSA